MYENHHADCAVECVAIAVRELCDMRDSDISDIINYRSLEIANTNFLVILKHSRYECHVDNIFMDALSYVE